MTSTAFELSREHEEFRRSVREFAEAEIAPHAAQWDKDHHFPVDVVQKMGQLGLFGLTAPEEYGGAGEDGDFTSLCVAIEEIGRVDQSMGITLEAAVGLGINPILTYGDDAQKERWLPDLVAGQTLAGFGLTEPGAGSDAGATRTRPSRSDTVPARRRVPRVRPAGLRSLDGRGAVGSGTARADPGARRSRCVPGRAARRAARVARGGRGLGGSGRR